MASQYVAIVQRNKALPAKGAKELEGVDLAKHGQVDKPVLDQINALGCSLNLLDKHYVLLDNFHFAAETGTLYMTVVGTDAQALGFKASGCTANSPANIVIVTVESADAQDGAHGTAQPRGPKEGGVHIEFVELFANAKIASKPIRDAKSKAVQMIFTCTAYAEDLATLAGDANFMIMAPQGSGKTPSGPGPEFLEQFKPEWAYALRA
ncbi:MAG: hypothetical protein IPL40_06095 [Proteobacteria bacterium]|nr:hypothetical protein [Pseudomonadota bacterium]